MHICKAPGGEIAECIKRPLILNGVFKDLKAQVGFKCLRNFECPRGPS